jgi:hypothetical protein
MLAILIYQAHDIMQGMVIACLYLDYLDFLITKDLNYHLSSSYMDLIEIS